MSLFINSPSYYTQLYGIHEEIYKMCRQIEKKIDIKAYTSQLDTVGITPIIAHEDEICAGKCKEVKKISLSYRFASISLRIDYSSYVSADITHKKSMILNNIFESLLLIKKRLKNNFDYEKIEKDILTLLDEQSI